MAGLPKYGQKPRMRFHDGLWRCYFVYRSSRGAYWGRSCGVGATMEEAFRDWKKIDQPEQVYRPSRA